MNLDFKSLNVIKLKVHPENVRIVGQTMGVTTSHGLLNGQVVMDK